MKFSFPKICSHSNFSSLIEKITFYVNESFSPLWQLFKENWDLKGLLKMRLKIFQKSRYSD